MWFNFFKEIILWLADLDARLLLIVNGAHSPFFDAVMWCISGRWIWVPFYIVLTYMLFRRFSWKRANAMSYHHRIDNTRSRPDLRLSHSSRSVPSASCQSQQSVVAVGACRQRLSWRQIRIPLMPCSQHLCSRYVHVACLPQQAVHGDDVLLGYRSELFANVSRRTLFRRPLLRSQCRLALRRPLLFAHEVPMRKAEDIAHSPIPSCFEHSIQS